MALGVVVHGGAGAIQADDRAKEAAAGCLAAAHTAYRVLKQGGKALDAVVAAAVVLEDDPLFNAGTGSVLNEDGDVELDASVMDGELNAGAVALVRTVKNPVLLARRVMEKSGHVLLASDGASPMKACADGVASLSRVRGDGGVIAINVRGEVGFAFNTQRMSRAFVTDAQTGSEFA